MALLPRKPAKHPAKPKRGKKLEVEEPGVLYGRYSSHNQKDISVEQQFEKGYELAAEYGIRIIDTYADRAVSGRTDKRRDFQRMMTDAAKGKFRYVIAWKSNRMGRNMLEALINEARLQDLGVRVLYVEEDFDDTAAGRFAARSMMNVNQFYSENMAEDIKRGLYDNAANCMVANGHLPYGYKADETLHYAIDEPKAAVIREIFTRVSCGEAFVDIMASLNARGIKTSYGRPWGRSSFQKILSNERYRGIYIYGDVRKEGGIPRIISDELYFKVQEVITTKKNPQGRHRVNGDYLLTGKLFCGHCKSPMTGISGTSRSGNLHYYYVCQKRRTEKTCEKKNLRRDDIELQVAKAIKRRTLDDDTINWIADSVVEYSQHQESASGIGLLEDQLKDTQRSIKNLMAAIEQGIITPTTKARLMELEKEQSDIDRKITMAKADVIPVNRDQLVGWLKKLQAGDVHDKKYQAELFDTFLIAVYVYDNPDGQDYMKVVFNYAGSKNTVEIPLDPSVIDNVENIETGAVRLSSAQVHQPENPAARRGCWIFCFQGTLSWHESSAIFGKTVHTGGCSMNKAEIYDLLRTRGIWHEITEHKAVYNMAELTDVALPYPEADAKNLFVRDDKKRNYYLITVRGDKRVDLKEFRHRYGTRALSFASENDLMQVLGLIPGAVTPLGLLNDAECKVQLYLDEAFFAAPGLIGVHPNDNTATVWLRADDLAALIREHGNPVHIAEL